MSIHEYSRNPLKRGLAEFIFQSQHGRCLLCQKETLLEIDHIDGNPSNWTMTNIRLLCAPCNLGQRNRLRRSVKVKEKEKIPATPVQEETGVVEIDLNRDYEGDYRRTVIRGLLNMGIELGPDGRVWPKLSYVKSEMLSANSLNAAACEFVGANPKTGYPYFAKMKNPINGFLDVLRHPTGKKVVMFKELSYYEKSEDEIMALHPKAGQKTRWEGTKPNAR